MISSSHRFIYLHAPKTGGNSIQTRLHPFSDDQVIVQGHQDGRDRFEIQGEITPFKHARLSDYAKVLGKGLADYRTVISVRDPFQRAVSFYFSPHRWMRKSPDTDTWALTEAFWDLEAFRTCLDGMVPMVDFLRVEGAVLQPDHVIRFETLAEDFSRCIEALGVPASLNDLPHVNRSAAAELAQDALLDASAAALVKDRMAEDYRFFGYDLR